MLTDLGFTDTLDRYASVSNYSGPIAHLAIKFAAVTSIHTCYSLIIGLSCFFLVRRRPLRFTWLFYPCLIVFSIIATANHFWPTILGGLLAAVALSAAWMIERHRPTLRARRESACISSPRRAPQPTRDSARGIVSGMSTPLARLRPGTQAAATSAWPSWAVSARCRSPPDHRRRFHRESGGRACGRAPFRVGWWSSSRARSLTSWTARWPARTAS
jgi:hypothetical protein